MEEAEILISEINQVREQWAAEAGQGGRRVWPRALRDRVMKLIDGGLPMKQIASRCRVPYETICQWKYQRDKGAKSFHQLPVVADAKAIANAGTVTAPSDQMASKDRPIVVRTPDGYVVRVWSEQSAVLVIATLRTGAR